MALVAHKYMPQEMAASELQTTFAAREHTLEYLLNALRGQSASKSLTSYLITGPRGAGKTTLVLMLRLRLRDDPALSKAWLPVLFPEECPAITSLRDLLVTALRILADDGHPEAAEWFEKAEQESDDERSQDLAVAGLQCIANSQNRRLILLIENLDMVFERGLDSRTQATLRRLLMTDPFLMIIGTAVHVFEALKTYDEAFFNYFCPVPLERLDDRQVRELMSRRAKYDQNDRFPEQYRRQRSGIRAITRLTGGNPRLILMLYEVLSGGQVQPVVQTLRQLVDELTPLLKDVLESLPPQQSKVLDALMRSGGIATPRQLATATRLELNKVTTQLQRLKESQIIEVRGGGKGRTAYYTVPDQLFCTWYQLRYLRPNRRRIEMFVELLKTWFDAEERLDSLPSLSQPATASEGAFLRYTAEAAECCAAPLISPAHVDAAQDLAVAQSPATSAEEWSERVHAIRTLVWMCVQTRDTRRRNQVLKRFVSDLAELDLEQRAAPIIALLRGLVHPRMKKDWCEIVEALTADQPQQVVQQLAPFRVVADVLRDGDSSRLDALPPEQCEFAAEVLEQFDAAGDEQQPPKPPSLAAASGGG